jgi:hypothetical protein
MKDGRGERDQKGKSCGRLCRPHSSVGRPVSVVDAAIRPNSVLASAGRRDARSDLGFAMRGVRPEGWMPPSISVVFVLLKAVVR